VRVLMPPMEEEVVQANQRVVLPSELGVSARTTRGWRQVEAGMVNSWMCFVWRSRRPILLAKNSRK